MLGTASSLSGFNTIYMWVGRSFKHLTFSSCPWPTQELGRLPLHWLHWLRLEGRVWDSAHSAAQRHIVCPCTGNGSNVAEQQMIPNYIGNFAKQDRQHTHTHSHAQHTYTRT
eukprot:925260-Amphidinium_carterae.1